MGESAQRRALMRTDAGRAPRRARARWRAVVATLVTTALVVIGGIVVDSTPARAALSGSFYATDELGSGAVEQFDQTEAVYLYVRTALSGGHVCVSAAVGVTCLRERIDIPPFTNGVVPVYAPEALPVGTYSFLEVDENGVPMTTPLPNGQVVVNRSAANFSIVGGACPEDQIDVCHLRRDAFKDAARRMALHSNAMTALGFAALLGGAAALWVAAPVLGGGPLAPIVIRLGVAGGLGFGSTAFASAATVASNAATRFNTLAADPPDPNFQSVAQPVLSDFPRPSDPREAALFDAQDRLNAYAEALLHALERFQGAQLAGDAAAAVLQADAMGEFGDAVAVAIDDYAAAMREFADDPGYASPFFQPGGRELALADQTRVGSQGFSDAEKAALTALGVDAADFAQIAARVADFDIDAVPADTTRAMYLHGLADQISVESLAFRELAADARNVSATIARDNEDVPLTAVISADALEGTAPLEVSFDASGSTPQSQITSYEWNFGNGAATTGQIATTLYTTPGTYLVQLIVRADDGRSAYATQLVTVEAPPNRPPIAAPDSVSVERGSIVDIPIGANDNDPDGSITSVSIVTPPAVGELECYSAQLCRYRAPDDVEGTVSFTYSITDDDGDTAQAVVTITIVAPGVPAAVDDHYTVARGSEWVLLVLANDYAPSPPLKISSSTPAADGTVTCEVGGTECRYTADGTASTDSFTYTAVDGEGRTTSATVTIAITDDNQPPIVQALRASVSAVEGGAISSYGVFGAYDPDGYIAAYEWSVDGVVVGTDVNVIPAVRDDGDYVLTLTARDDQGATASANVALAVSNQLPYVAGLDVHPRANPGVARVLRATAFDPGLDDLPVVHWDFGDGTTAEGDEVSHLFAEGSYTVTYWAVDKDGGTSGTAAIDLASFVPVADLGPDLEVFEGEDAVFDLSGTTPADDRLRYELAYGDGHVDIVPSPTPSSLPYRYARAGVYTAILTQQDSLTVGEPPVVRSDTATVEVHNVAPTVLGVAHSLPVAGRATSFTAFAHDPGGLEGVEYEWDFGDGFQPGGRTASKTFAATGSADVRVRVTDVFGGSSVHTETVTVTAAAAALPYQSSGTDFWVAFGLNYADEAAGQYIALYIAGAPGTTGGVEVPGLGFVDAFTVPAAGIVRVDLPIAARLGRGGPPSDRIEPRAVHIESTAEVTVYGINRMPFSTDAFLALPTQSLGTRYRVLDYSPGAFAVVAVEGETVLSFTPAPGLTIEPFQRTLQVGEAFEFETQGANLTGSLIATDRPVAVFGESRCANVPSGYFYCDHLDEMLAPTGAWGRSYATMPLATRAADTYRIVADVADTIVTVAGAVDDIFTLQPGEYRELAASGPLHITATEPIMVGQYSQGSTTDNTISDPFIAMVAPLEQGFTDSVFATPVVGFSDYVNIIAPTAHTASVLLDGVALDASAWTPIAGSGHSGAVVPIEPGVHRIGSPVAVSTLVYGFGADDSYGFPGGMRVARIAEIESLALAPASVAGTPGDELCTTATLAGAQQPIAGARLDVVVDGVVDDVFSVVTDADGSSDVCVTSAGAGEASVVVSIGDQQRSATFTWVAEGQHLPDVTLSLPPAPLEATTVPVTAVASDADGDELTYAWDLDADGEHDDATGATASLVLPVAGSYPVSVRVSDGSGTVTVPGTVVAGNVVPVVTLPAAVTIGRDGVLDLAGSFADPGADTWTATVEWGDGEVTLPLDGWAFALAREFDAPGGYPVTVKVRDTLGGGVGTATVIVTVPGNQAPVVEQLGDRTVTEGDVVRLQPVVSDLDADPVTLTWTAGAAPLIATPLPTVCSAVEDDGALVVECADDAVVIVRLEATDAPAQPENARITPSGETTTVWATLTFRNAAPTVATPVVEAAPGGPAGFSRAVVPLSTVFAAPLPQGPLDATAGFTDPGADEFECGAEIGAQQFEGVVDGGECAIDLPAPAPGAHALTVWVQDDDGGIGRSSLLFDVAAAEPEPTGSSTPTSTPTPTVDPRQASPTAPASGSAGSLPATGGGSVDALVLLALALIAAGLVARTRRRSSAG